MMHKITDSQDLKLKREDQ